MSHPTRWVVVGTSSHGRRVAARTIRESGQAVLLGGVGSTEEKSRAFAKDLDLPRSYFSLEAALSDEDVEAVWICSPNDLHAEHTRAAAAAGKHVFLEKPFATKPD